MQFYLCIDDTDTIDSIGTGTICEEIRNTLIGDNIARCHPITRHQLLIHEDIPYTSHNSSMCFEGELLEGTINDVIRIGKSVLNVRSAKGSDPGLCVAQVTETIKRDALVEFGYKATQVVLTKRDAYSLAEKMGIHLSEHGGTGQGVVGAIAGVGLRISGNNGEGKGILKKVSNRTYSVKELLDLDGIQKVMDTSGHVLEDRVTVHIQEPTKIQLHNHKFTLFAEQKPEGYVALTKKVVRSLQLGNQVFRLSNSCDLFRPDVPEEQIEHELKSCLNCTYRRWTHTGIECVKGMYET